MKKLLLGLLLLSSTYCFADNHKCQYEEDNWFHISMNYNERGIAESFMDEKQNIGANAIDSVQYNSKTSDSSLVDYMAYSLSEVLHLVGLECDPDVQAAHAGTGEFVVKYLNDENKNCTARIAVEGTVSAFDFQSDYNISLALKNSAIICN